MTRLVTAGAVLVLAIVFGFIFWNQFVSNQQQLAGGTPQTNSTTNNSTSQTQNTVPKNDSVGSIETELNTFDANGIDSDSAELNSELTGF